MCCFLSNTTSNSPPQSYWHPGDLIWTLFQNTRFDPHESIRLWESSSELLGFALLEEPDGVILQVHPGLKGSGILEEEMLLWASERLSDPERNPEAEIWTRALDSDSRFLELLAEHGFRRDEDHAVKMRHRMDSIPSDPAPEGWTVRAVCGEEEWNERVELHRKVWQPSRVTLDAYRRLRTVEGYDPDLDLVAVDLSGAPGAYCICWYDPSSKTGLFEPVGTHPAHQRRGLGRAIMLEGLKRLRDFGALTVFITYVHGNDAAKRLYESVGFQAVEKEQLYGKKLES